jgi:hypothetical protein
MGLGSILAVVASTLVTALGLFLVVVAAGSDMAVFGWLLVGVGAVFVLVNLLLRARM